MISHRAAHHLGRRRRRRRGKRRKPPARAQLQRVNKARERGNNTGTAAGSSEGGLPRLSAELSSASICRYSPRVTLLPHLERAGAGAALKHMSAFVCHRDSLRCSLARSLARLQFEPAEPGIVSRISRTTPLPSSYRAAPATLARHCSFFFNIPRSIGPRPRAFISPMIFVFGLSYTSFSLSLSRERNSSRWPASKLSIYRTWFISAPSQCRE